MSELLKRKCLGCKSLDNLLICDCCSYTSSRYFCQACKNSIGHKCRPKLDLNECIVITERKISIPVFSSYYIQDLFMRKKKM